MNIERPYVPSHEDRPKEDPEHETVVLEMYVIHNEKARVEEQRRGYDALHGRILCPTNEPEMNI